MKNLTLAIDETLLAKARELAARRHTSLNALIRNLLVEELDQHDRIAWAREGMKRLIENSSIEFPVGTNLKELSRRDDASDLHGHQHTAVGSRKAAERPSQKRNRS